MNRFATSLGKWLAAAAGLRVRREGLENRFDAMGDTLRLMRTLGYAPRVVIDAGANLGQWSTLASAVFPEARVHLIEPQPGCHARLATLEAPRFRLHPVAITAPGASTVRMAGGGPAGVGTGAFVTAGPVPPDARGPGAALEVIDCPATTLDSLFAATLTTGDRALLKLDVEGHEIDALKGATAMLPCVEAIVCEVTFFDVGRTGHALFADVLDHLRGEGFALFDVAALAPRPRDQRLRTGDAVFVREGSALLDDVSWE